MLAVARCLGAAAAPPAFVRCITYDALIVGSGIVGSSVAQALTQQGAGTLAMLEQEGSHGYHSTGRSAALYSETYGSPLTRALTTASRPVFEGTAPAPLPAEAPFLTPRGVVWLARDDQVPTMDAMLKDVADQGLVTSLARIDAAELARRVPALRPDYAAAGVVEPDAMDIDVNGLHMALLRAARATASVLDVRLGAELVEAVWSDKAGVWSVTDSSGSVSKARFLVNAAGAWGDVVAQRAGMPGVGLVPKKRTMITWDLPSADAYPDGPDPARWPMVFDVDEQFYFKPDAGQMLGSPADASPTDPHDAYAEEMDMAVCADRIMTATDLEITALNSSWAGLRTFAPDGDFVLGPDPGTPSFVWAVGMGGYGIQTAPAMGDLVAAATTGSSLSAPIVDAGITTHRVFGPDRPTLT